MKYVCLFLKEEILPSGLQNVIISYRYVEHHSYVFKNYLGRFIFIVFYNAMVDNRLWGGKIAIEVDVKLLRSNQASMTINNEFLNQKHM